MYNPNVSFTYYARCFLAKTAEAAEETGIGLIDSGACGEVSYDFYDEYNNYIFFQADKSVQYKLYKDGTMVISGNGENLYLQSVRG